MRKYVLIIFSAVILMLVGCGNNKNDSIQNQSDNQLDDSNITAVDKDINNLTFLENAGYDDTYKNEIVKTVNTVNKTSNSDSVSYVFITDTHLGSDENQEDIIYRQLSAAVDVANNSAVDFLCLGGDIEDGRFTASRGGKQKALDYLQKVSDILKNCRKPVFILKGNHDDNSFSAQIDSDLFYDPDYIINNAEWYNATMGNFSQYATDYHNGYYYYDLPDKNTRVVCLNMSDSSDKITDGKKEEIGMHFYGYKDEQIEWLLNSAMSRTDCKYIFMCHDGFDYIEGYDGDSNRDVLAAILSAAYRHDKFDMAGFSKDFTNWTGNVLIYNNGHMHMDKMLVEDDLGGLPALSNESAALFSYNYKDISTLPYPWNTYSRTEGRKTGSVDEAAFNVIVCNGSQKGDTTVIKFGKGEDKVY